MVLDTTKIIRELELDPFVSLDDAAAISSSVGVKAHVETWRKWAREEKFTTTKIGNRFYIRQSELDKILSLGF